MSFFRSLGILWPLLLILSSCASFSGIRLDDPEERAAIIRDINQGGRFNYRINPDDLPGLRDLLMSENEIERFAGVVLLEQYTGEEKVPLLLGLIEDESERIRNRINLDLEEERELYLTFIRNNLLAAETDTLKIFLRILSRLGEENDILLISELFETDDRGTALSASLAIIRLAGSSLLINSGLLESESENKRKYAYMALGKYNDPDLIPEIVNGLQDESREVRNEAAFSLNQFGDAVLPYLYPLLETGSYYEAESALYLLIPLHSEESIPYVIPLINENSGSLKEQSIAFIRSFGDAAIPFLRQKAREGNRRERREAVKLLVELNDYDSSGMFLDFLLLNDEALKNILESALYSWGEKIFPFLYRNMEESESRARQSLIWLRELGDAELCYSEEKSGLDIQHSLYLFQYSSLNEMESYFERISFNVRLADDFRRFFALYYQIPQFQQLKRSMTEKDNNLYLYYFRLYEEAQVKSRENMDNSFRLTQEYIDTGKDDFLNQAQEARDAGIRYREEAEYLEALLKEMKNNPDSGEMLSREYSRLRKVITDSWYLSRDESRPVAKAVYESLGLNINTLLAEEQRISH